MLPWSPEILELYRNHWDWSWVSNKKKLPWSMELIEKFENYWEWGILAWNNTLPTPQLTLQDIDEIMEKITASSKNK